ncbi:MAG: Ig-like domain-containing protein [Gemmatimonadota bacterium]
MRPRLLILALPLAALAACDSPNTPPEPLAVAPGQATILVRDSLQLEAQGASGPVDWASLNPSVATVGTTGVVVGLASGSATITATAAGRVATAEVTVVGRAVLVGSDTLIVFATGPTEPAPAPRTLSLANAGEAPLIGLAATVAYEDAVGGWLGVRVDTAGGDARLTLTPQGAGAPIGVYRASVRVTADKAEKSPLTIPVQLTVAEPARIVVEPDTIRLSALVGGASRTGSAGIHNGGERPLGRLSLDVEYPATGTAGWLHVALSEEQAPSELSLDASASALGEGVYSATVWIRSDLPHIAPVPVAVEFDVGPQPAIGVSPTSIAFYALQDSIDPLPQTLRITNVGSGSLSDLSVAAPRYGPGASGWLSVSLMGSTAPAQVTLSASIAGLLGGTYYADLDVSSPAAVESPRTVRVVLTVEGPWIYFAFPGTAYHIARGEREGPGWFPVYNGGGGILSGLQVRVEANGPPGFISVGFNGPPVAPVSVGVSRSGVGIPVGLYTADVIVSSTLPNVRPDTMHFIVSVVPEPVIVLDPSPATLTAAVGGSASLMLAVSNGGGGLLHTLAASISYPSGPTGWLSAKVNSNWGIELLANAASLGPGTYAATLHVTSPQPLVLPVDVQVTLVVN